MTTLSPSYGTSTTIVITSATSLAALGMAGSAAINISGLSPVPDDVMITVFPTLGAGTPADQKGVNVYIAMSEDGTHFTDQQYYSGNDNAVVVMTPNNFSQPLFISTVNSGVLSFTGVIPSVSRQIGAPQYLPRKIGLIVENRSNIAFTAFSATFTPVTWTNV